MTLDRGRGGNVVLPAAVGQNLSTAVKGAASAYDGLNDLNHVMNMNDVCKEVLYWYEPSTSVDGLRVLWKHGPADCVSPVNGILCMWSAVDGEVPSLYELCCDDMYVMELCYDAMLNSLRKETRRTYGIR
ncbi:hypothetical protein E3N88_09171 [Mikania micrantha]|uniref:Uncharacterized protein n=1 Tax=Mikania micrantha TaxID=192012 RepID=A0A5N6PLD7_9ASTR|nr:hypothetical protein E3N88_09171 [Mikania micrantha]